MLPSVLINSVAISSIALGTESPKSKEWGAIGGDVGEQERREHRSPARAFRAGMGASHKVGVFSFIDVRFHINFHLKQKACPAPIRAAKAPGPQIRTVGFLSAVFQAQIEVGAHGWGVGGYVRKGVARAAGGVRVSGSFILGLVTPRIIPTIHVRKIYVAYFM